MSTTALAKNKIVLITGAGASKDLYESFGLGIDLINEIEIEIKKILELPLQTFTVGNLVVSTEDFNEFNRVISKYKVNGSYWASIDFILDEINIFPEYKNSRARLLGIGTAIIMQVVLNWEALSISENTNTSKTNWLKHLTRCLQKENIFQELDFETFKVITFNYDRAIEYSLLNYINFKETRAKTRWLENCIHHVYGILAQLPGMTENSSFKVVQYGNTDRRERLWRQLQNIRTIYDNRFYSSEIKDYVFAADRIGIMGFGYDELNCKILGLERLNDFGKTKEVLANIYYPKNITENEIKNVRETIRRLRSIYPDMKFTFLSCLDFVKYLMNG